jgi:hypothetical protein
MGFDWSQDITDDSSYRRCYLKQISPPPNHDVRYVAGFLRSAVHSPSPLATPVAAGRVHAAGSPGPLAATIAAG